MLSTVPDAEGRRDRQRGTALEAVAKEAGLGPGNLYRHFPTREALPARRWSLLVLDSFGGRASHG